MVDDERGCGGLLAGLRVVEVSSFVAAPLGGMTLAQLGADVIRVDPIGGGADIDRWPVAGQVSLYWVGLNKEKRSLTVDFGSERGRELVRSLIRDRGVVLTNAGSRGWLSYPELHGLRSDLIHVQIDGMHDGSSGVDYTVNAATGFPLVTGPAAWGGPINHVLPAWDISCGLYSALALLAAERHRTRTGQGSRLRVALEDVAVATAGNLGYLAEAQLNEIDRPRIGNHLYGSFARDFPTADGRRLMVVALTRRNWRDLVMLTGIESAVQALEAALGVDLTAEESRYRYREVIAGLVEPWFAARTLDQAAAELRRTSVLWSAYRSFAELVAHHRRLDPAETILTEIDQPGVGRHLAPGSPVVWGPPDRPATTRPAPVLGADTRQILRQELGIEAAEMDRLAAAGVIPS